MNRRHLLLGLLAIVVAVELLVRDGYEKVLDVHVDVLQSLADKTGALASAGGRPTPNDLTEMIYPLERARGFLRDYRDEDARESYRSFAALVDEYAALVSAVDAARGVPEQWEALREDVARRARLVEESAARVRAAAARES